MNSVYHLGFGKRRKTKLPRLTVLCFANVMNTISLYFFLYNCVQYKGKKICSPPIFAYKQTSYPLLVRKNKTSRSQLSILQKNMQTFFFFCIQTNFPSNINKTPESQSSMFSFDHVSIQAFNNLYHNGLNNVSMTPGPSFSNSDPIYDSNNIRAPFCLPKRTFCDFSAAIRGLAG